jgi:hypothetical protein
VIDYINDERLRRRVQDLCAAYLSQNRELQVNQTIEAEIKQAHTGIASQVRGLAEKLEPKSARKAVKRKKVIRKKPVATKKKPLVRRGRAKPTEKAAEPTETTSP